MQVAWGWQGDHDKKFLNNFEKTMNKYVITFFTLSII